MRTVPGCMKWLVLATCMGACAAPAALAAVGSATLSWTAPGDDGRVGRAAAYDLRYSLAPITEANFLSATPDPGVPAPKPAGSPETYTITDLVLGSGYYFAIKTADEGANWSAISNVAYQSIFATEPVPVRPAAWLSSPWPAPARESASWSYSHTESGAIDIDVFDLAGRRVRSVVRGWHDAGEGVVSWDLRDDGGRSIASGVYLVRAALAGQNSVKRLVVSR